MSFMPTVDEEIIDEVLLKVISKRPRTSWFL